RQPTHSAPRAEGRVVADRTAGAHHRAAHGDSAQVPGTRGGQRGPSGGHAAGRDPRSARAFLGPGHARLQEAESIEATSTSMRIIGVGAIGGVVGGMLTKAGHDITLIDQWPDHVEAMKKVGLRLSGTCGEHLIPVRALNIHELQSIAEPFDAIFIAVKSYDTE